MNQGVSFSFLYFSKYFRLWLFKFINKHLNLFLPILLFLFHASAYDCVTV